MVKRDTATTRKHIDLLEATLNLLREHLEREADEGVEALEVSVNRAFPPSQAPRSKGNTPSRWSPERREAWREKLRQAARRQHEKRRQERGVA